MREKSRYREVHRYMSVFAVLAVSILLLRYALGIVFPFVAAAIVGYAIARLAKYSSKTLCGGVRAWTVFYLCVITGALAVIIMLTVREIVEQANGFIDFVLKNAKQIEKIIEDTVGKLELYLSQIPFISQLGGGKENVSELVSRLFDTLVQKGGALVGEWAGELIASAPEKVISCVVFAISATYFALDYDKITGYFRHNISPQMRCSAGGVIKRVKKGLHSYFSVSLKIFLLTFAELSVGLLILGKRYILITALAIALLDVLPFFGAPFVCITWGGVLWLSGRVGEGVAMLVLGAVIAIVRQIAEPRFVGKDFGMHPLAALASIYIGVRLLGFLGIIVGPVYAIIIREFLESTHECADRCN